MAETPADVRRDIEETRERMSTTLTELEQRDPARAAVVRKRARDAAARLRGDFPGNPRTGILAEDEASQARFARPPPRPWRQRAPRGARSAPRSMTSLPT